MKEHPILFSGPMVRAILDGRKTQTRRVVKPQPPNEHCVPGRIEGTQNKALEGRYCWYDKNEPYQSPPYFLCPYGVPGDRLWVRETWAMSGHNRVEYRAFPADGKDFRCVMGWKPSIHIPRRYSRILLEIDNIRVERVQDIGENDACAEGITEYSNGDMALAAIGAGMLASNPKMSRRAFMSSLLSLGLWATTAKGAQPTSHHGAFAALWDTINASRGYGWNVNPWVWVIDFHRIEQEARP